MSLLGRALSAFTDWALSKNPPGTYAGEDVDKRWAYTIVSKGEPYLTRVLAPQWFHRMFGFRPYLHHFHRPDGDRHLHSHPWRWAVSFILSGAYIETRVDEDSTRLVQEIGLGTYGDVHEARLVRWFNYLTGEDYHKVDELRGDVWTLFIAGPRDRDWGFRVNGHHVPWKKYLGVEQ